MKTRTRSAAVLATVLSVAALLVGCLIAEEEEYSIKLNPDGKGGMITSVKYNVQSDQSDRTKQKEDFDGLIKDWKSDDYLLEKVKEGVYVKSRELTTKQGKLIWKEVAIFSDFTQLFRKELAGDTLRLSFDKDQTIVSTNGIVERTADKTVVTWLPGLSEYKLRIRHNAFVPRSDFARDFRKLFKK